MLRNRPLWMAIVGLVVAATPVFAADADKYLPSDSKLVVTINVQQLLQSPVVKKHALEKVKDELKKNAEAQQFLTAVGLDPLKDITRVVVAGNPGLNDAEKVLVIAHGKFDLAKVEAAADAHAKSHPKDLKISKEGSTRLYELKGQDDKPVDAAFVDKETLLFSSNKAYVLDGIAKASGKSESSVGKDLLGVLSKVDTKSAVWGAVIIPDDIKQIASAVPQLADVAEKLQALTAAVGVTNDVNLDISFHTSDDKSAEMLRKKLEEAKPLGVAQAQGLPGVGKQVSDVVDSIKIKADKGTVTISLKVTDEQIGGAIKQAPKGDK